MSRLSVQHLNYELLICYGSTAVNINAMTAIISVASILHRKRRHHHEYALLCLRIEPVLDLRSSIAGTVGVAAADSDDGILHI